ncbi:vacuolar ATPase assembly integral membrane protein VMA21 homolog [Microplitis demolitor]|uniref:vacuolar ATPase assembly integral membrane protein VMA21 homolog n=1 Tax=Microplitis demolitor TaxID=69319 RepID=UPI00235B66ED|nr:vacuolar ATPase assembly integral membrane protein VMA21 homolog [Microplitis demolitor]
MIIRELADFQIFKTIFYYCANIIFLPVLTFFVSKIFLLEGLFKLDSMQSSVTAAIMSVIALHIALGAFIFKAYSDSPAKVTDKKD